MRLLYINPSIFKNWLKIDKNISKSKWFFYRMEYTILFNYFKLDSYIFIFLKTNRLQNLKPYYSSDNTLRPNDIKYSQWARDEKLLSYIHFVKGPGNVVIQPRFYHFWTQILYYTLYINKIENKGERGEGMGACQIQITTC